LLTALAVAFSVLVLDKQSLEMALKNSSYAYILEIGSTTQ